MEGVAVSTSDLEAELIFQLRVQKVSGWQLEYRFHPKRRWRFDIAFPSEMVACEVQGGLHKFGRHNRPAGYTNDAWKLAESQLLGWTLLYITPEMIRQNEAVPLIKRALEQREESA